MKSIAFVIYKVARLVMFGVVVMQILLFKGSAAEVPPRKSF